MVGLGAALFLLVAMLSLQAGAMVMGPFGPLITPPGPTIWPFGPTTCPFGAPGKAGMGPFGPMMGGAFGA